MAERIQRKSNSSVESSEVATESLSSDSDTGQRLRAELDDLLDEIDEVLETNAEEFVRAYVQKGGE
ncbi:MAG: ubiquitin-like protein Pup [Actinobacteria bacterium]|jgi:ubiquitin-like protein Pup|nr:ubiquitin-like protein Pup [Actinomycetota bacterium]